MTRIGTLILLFVSLSLTACTTAARTGEGGANIRAAGQEDALTPKEKILVHYVLDEILTSTPKTTEKKSSKSEPKDHFSFVDDEFDVVATIYVYSDKQYDAAVRIVKRFTRRRNDSVSLEVTNKTKRSLVLRAGPDFWKVEIPLGAGESQVFSGSLIGVLDGSTIEIIEPEKTDK